jgi:DNA-binding transcriptional ArsR family regulator
VDVISVFAEPRRRDILRLVLARELPAGEIVARFDVSAAAISQHLRVLREAGFLHERREGTRRFYRARPEGLESVRTYVERFWTESLGRLKETIESDEPKRRAHKS